METDIISALSQNWKLITNTDSKNDLMEDFTMKEFWTTIQFVFAAIGGWLGYFLGGCDGLLYALIAFTVVDYITGVMCAIVDEKLVQLCWLQRHLPQGTDFHSGGHRKYSRCSGDWHWLCTENGSHLLLPFQ